MKTPVILVIDTATEALSVAIKTEHQSFQHFEECPQQHSQKILPIIDSLCQQANITIRDVDFIGFGQGPGSFTGVRIAISTVQGLAMGLNVKVCGVSTLAAMAQECIDLHLATDTLVAIDARMNEVYFAHYQVSDGHAVLCGEERVLSPELAAEYAKKYPHALKAGTGWQAYPALTECVAEREVAVTLPNALFMLPSVIAAVSNGEVESIDDVAPTYLRDTVTWKKLPGRE